MSICPHTLVCPHMFWCPLYAWMPPYVLMQPLYVWMPPYVWMAACMFGCPHYVWMILVCFDAPICLDITHMFGCPLYVLDTPICLDAPFMFGCPPYVWTPHMFGCPSDLWMPLYIWQHSNVQGVAKHVVASNHIEGCPNGGHPNIQGASNHMGECKHGGVQTYRWASKHMGVSKHKGGIPTFRGTFKHMGASKHKGESKCMGTYGHPLSLAKHAFFVLYMYSRHPNIQGGIQTYGECPNIPVASKHVGVSKHMGAIWTYRGHPNIWGIQMYGVYGHPFSLTKHAFFLLFMYRGHPNIIKTYGGIQTYGGCPNIQWSSKHVGKSKCMGAYGHPLSLTKHAFFVLCMYRRHSNIWREHFLYNPELCLPSWISAILFFFF